MEKRFERDVYERRIQPVLQREYQRTREMTIAQMLLDNRIIFIGSSPETGGDPT